MKPAAASSRRSTGTHPAPDLVTSPYRRDALRDVGRFMPGTVPFALFVGVALASVDQGGQAALGAVLFIGGSAQLTTASVLSAGSGVTAAVLAGLVVNARMLLYGAALAPRFAHLPPVRRWAAAVLVVDQTFLAAEERDPRDPAFVRYWWWSGGATFVAYCSLVGAGVLLEPHLRAVPHISLVGTALFVSMLAPRVGQRTTVVVAGAAAIGAVAGLLVVSWLAIPLGMLCGVLAGSAHGSRRGRAA